MNEFRIDKDIIDCIEALYKQSKFSVLVGGVVSDPFSTNIGVRQGCPLSPCLFNLHLKNIMTTALEGFKGTVSIGGREINNIRFADDINLITGTLPELANLTDRLDKASTLYGMKLKVKKSKILSMGTKDPQPDRLIYRRLYGYSGLIKVPGNRPSR